MAALHIGWMVLNVGLAISLYLVSFRNFRVFSQRFGMIPSGLVLVLIASMCQSPARKPSELPSSTFKRVIPTFAQPTDWSDSYDIPLVTYPTLRLTQQVYLMHHTQPDSVQITSMTSLTRFVLGLQWSPANTYVDIHPDLTMNYEASGLLEWKLLGLTVYRQHKYFAGKVALKSVETR